MELEQLVKETNALTYMNALKVTLTRVKDCVSEIEALHSHMTEQCEEARKLMRKADNQYRLIAKIVQNGQAPLATDIKVSEDMETIEELIKNE